MESFTYLVIAGVALAGLAILTFAGLKAFDGWLGLKRAELANSGRASALPTTSARIEVADLKERIRKLEAIAAGVEL